MHLTVEDVWLKWVVMIHNESAAYRNSDFTWKRKEDVAALLCLFDRRPLSTTMSAYRSERITTRKTFKNGTEFFICSNITSHHRSQSRFLTLLGDLSDFDPQEEIHVTAFKSPLPLLGWPCWCDILLYVFQMAGRRTRLAIRLLLIYCRRRSRCSSVPSPCLSALFPVSFYKTSSKERQEGSVSPRLVHPFIHLCIHTVHTVYAHV